MITAAPHHPSDARTSPRRAATLARLACALLLSALMLGPRPASASPDLEPYWDSSREIVVDVSTAGVRGDGATDNAFALQQLRDSLIARDRHAYWRLVFPPGDYLYSNNRWLYGLTRVRVSGQGATFQSTSTARYVNDFNAFPRQGMFSLQGDLDSAPRGPGERPELYISGDRIATAEAGQQSITLTDPADAARYEAGDRILVHGYALMSFGYTPNLREFEWRRVSAVQGQQLLLDQPLQRRYDARWPDYGYMPAGQRGNFRSEAVAFGKPRVLLLDDRPQVVGRYFYPEIVWVEGITFRANPSARILQSVAFAAHTVILKDLILTGTNDYNLYARESARTIIDNVDVANVFEFDKVANEVIVRNSRIRRMKAKEPHAMKSGTGIRNITIDNNVVDGRINVIALDNLTIRNNQIDSTHLPDRDRWGAVSFYNGQFVGRVADISNNRVRKKPQQSVVVQQTRMQRHPVEAVGPGGSIVVPREQNGKRRGGEDVPKLARLLQPGMQVRLARDPQIIGIVDDIYEGQFGFLELRWSGGNLAQNVRVGDVLRWESVESVTESNNSTIN